MFNIKKICLKMDTFLLSVARVVYSFHINIYLEICKYHENCSYSVDYYER